MGSGLFSQFYGKRSPNRVDPGQGVGEEALGTYAGPRLKSYSVGFGAGFTSQTAIVNAQVVSGGTTPTESAHLNLTLAALFNGCLGGLSYGLAVHNSAGARDYLIRTYGFNQFGKSVTEDIAFTAAPINATTRVNGSRIFARISAVHVVSRNLNGTPTGNDTLSVGNFNTDNPIIGLPWRCEEPSDLHSLTLVRYSAVGIGVGFIDASGEARGSILDAAFNFAEQSVSFPITWSVNETTNAAIITMGCRTSMGTAEIGGRAGTGGQIIVK